MTESKPLVSVIMPVYNCAQYVDEAIESILNQTYKNLEIFIIDDCSTDGTKEIVESWAMLDERIKPIYKSVNTGYVESLNMAIGLSNGEYIARMDGDDISLPERIERQVEYMEQNENVGLIGSGHYIIGTENVFIPQTGENRIIIGLILSNQLSHPTAFFRKTSLLEQGRLYLHQFIPAEDYEFWVYLSNKIVIRNLDIPLLNYRSHAQGTSKLKPNNLHDAFFVRQILIRLNEDVSDEVIGLFHSMHVGNAELRSYIHKINTNSILDELLSLKDLNKEKTVYDIAEFNKFINITLILIFVVKGWKNSFVFLNSSKKKLILLHTYLQFVKKGTPPRLISYFNDFLPSTPLNFNVKNSY